MTKRCTNCGNILMGSEEHGDICNECLLIPCEEESDLPPFGTAEYWDIIEADGRPFYFADSPYPDGSRHISPEDY